MTADRLLGVNENIKRKKIEQYVLRFQEALGERIMKYSPDQEIRLEAAARLAFYHCEMGRKEIGRLFMIL